MLNKIILAAGLLLSIGANANNVNSLVGQINQTLFAETRAGGFDWKVGDTASYGLNMGFIKGSMVMTVKELTSDTLTLSQVMDLGFAGKQDCVMQLDIHNGKAKSLVCNGQNQTVPENDIEVIDMVEEEVTVPAGTFNSIHITAKQKSDQKEINQWANPKLVPVMGLIKAVSPSQLGSVTVELKSFKKN